MSTESSQPSTIELVLAQTQQIQQAIEEMIARTGEHPICELKREWRRDTLHNKAEFIKDIQSIVNSAIPEGQEKYLVVGVDEPSRNFTGCNHADFDDAGIRHLLEIYLDPTPAFEILCFRNQQHAADYVVFRFPHQPNRPFVIRSQIRDNNRTYLEEGEIWFKPGGPATPTSGKRRIRSRQEYLDLINIEPRVQREVDERINQLLPQIRLQERTRIQPQSVNAVSALTMTDEEFEAYVEQLLLTSNQSHFNLLIEKLRDKTVEVWQIDTDNSARLTRDEVLRIKETEFIPGMRRLTLLGLLLIKNSGPQGWFSGIAGLLDEIFNVSHYLGKLTPNVQATDTVPSLDQHASHTVPAIESLLSSYVLAGYELKRKFNSYMGIIFSRIVRRVGDPYETQPEKIFMFAWPNDSWGEADIRRDQMVIERYARGDRIERLFNGRNRMQLAALQVDCLIEWHSFLSFPEMGEPETVEYYTGRYPNVSAAFYPDFIFENLELVSPFIEQLWSSIHTGQKEFWLVLPALGDTFRRLDIERRENVLARFLISLGREHNRIMTSARRIPYRFYWPEEISSVIQRVRNNESAK